MVASSDAAHAALLLLEFVIAETTPARRWPGAALSVAGLLARVAPGRSRSLADGLLPVLAERAAWRSHQGAQLALDTSSIEFGVQLLRT